jgi:hypothetical protein
MENGRCRFHGGRVPKGKDWHRPRYPDGNAPDAVQRADRKVRDLQRAAAKRKKRLAAMTPEERSAYEAWRRAHKPGAPAERARLREERRQTEDFRKRVAEAVRTQSPPDEIEQSLRELRLQLAIASGEGVFG